MTARTTAGGDVAVDGVPLTEVAGRYGTPTYVVDEDDVRPRCRDYCGILDADEVAYAAKG